MLSNETIREEFDSLTTRFGSDLMKAAIAQQLETDDGVSDSDELIEAVDENALEDFVDSEFFPLREELSDEFGYDEVDDFLLDYIGKIADTPASEPIGCATTVTHAAAISTAPVAAPVQQAASVNTTPIAATPAPQQNAQNQNAQPVSAPIAPAVPAAPTYTNFVPDKWEAGFKNWSDFVQALDDVAATESVWTHDEDMLASCAGIDPVQPNIKIVPIDNSPIQAAAMAQKMKVTVPEAVLNTMKDEGGTGLAMKMENGRIVPIGWSAIDGLAARAGFTSDGFTRHWDKSADVAANELNGQLANGSGGVTIIENCHKIRAVNSARFAYGKISDIARMFEAFWKKNYPNATVQHLYTSHTATTWELNLEQYKSQIFGGFNGLMQSGYYPILMFSTSNTANSAFRVTPALAQTGSNLAIPMCENDRGIRITHIGKGNFTERVNGLMDKIRAAYMETETMMNNAASKIVDLQKITVNNAYNALLRELDELNFPKKQGHEAAENFKNGFGSGPASAFDCFIAVANAYSFVARDYSGNTKQQFAVALLVGRAASAQWEYYGNIPGDYQGY